MSDCKLEDVKMHQRPSSPQSNDEETPVIFSQFPRLPAEIRQRIFFEGLPKQERLIALHLSPLILKTESPKPSSGDTHEYRTVGAHVSAVDAPPKRRLNGVEDAYRGFVEPAHTQHLINAIHGVNKEAKEVVEWLYPDVIPLHIVYRGAFKNRRKRWPCFVEVLRGKALASWRKRTKSKIQLRCSLDHDIFHIVANETSYIKFSTLKKGPFPRSENIRSLLEGADILRGMSRIVPYSWPRNKHMEGKILKEMWSVTEIIHHTNTVTTYYNPASREGRNNVQHTFHLVKTEWPEGYLKDPNMVWGGARLAKPNRVRPLTLWHAQFRKIHSLFLWGDIDEVEFMRLVTEQRVSLIKGAPSTHGTLSGRYTRPKYGWVRICDPPSEEVHPDLLDV